MGEKPKLIQKITITHFILFFCSWSFADNANFQNFFFNACTNPTGALAVRCAETPNGLGDLSGSSESSLNPSQALTNADASIASARARNNQSNERNEWNQQSEASESGVQMDLGDFSLLLNARTAQDEQDRKVDIDGERGYNMDAWGLEFGFDYRASSNVVLGALLAWEGSEIDFDGESADINFFPTANNAGEIEHDAIALTVFAAIEVSKNSYLSASVGYVSNDYSVRRNSVFQESNRVIPQVDVRVGAEFDGTDTWASLSWGFIHNQNSWAVSPHISFVYSRSEIDAFSEADLNNSGLAMSFGDLERTSLIGQLGISVSGSWSTSTALFIPQIRFEYEHEFDRDAPATTASFLLDTTNSQYQINGDSPDRDTFNIGVGVLGIFPNGWMPFFDYQILLGDDDRDGYRITAGLRKEL